MTKTILFKQSRRSRSSTSNAITWTWMKAFNLVYELSTWVSSSSHPLWPAPSLLSKSYFKILKNTSKCLSPPNIWMVLSPRWSWKSNTKNTGPTTILIWSSTIHRQTLRISPQTPRTLVRGGHILRKRARLDRWGNLRKHQELWNQINQTLLSMTLSSREVWWLQQLGKIHWVRVLSKQTGLLQWFNLTTMS